MFDKSSIGYKPRSKPKFYKNYFVKHSPNIVTNATYTYCNIYGHLVIIWCGFQKESKPTFKDSKPFAYQSTKNRGMMSGSLIKVKDKLGSQDFVSLPKYNMKTSYFWREWKELCISKLISNFLTCLFTTLCMILSLVFKEYVVV